MSRMLQNFMFEALLLHMLVTRVTLTLGQNVDDLDNHDDFHSCVESGELCGGVNDCCASLECDVNEPVARCVHAIELGTQNEEYEGSGRALIEETSQPANDTRSGIGKLARLKESIMNIFKHSEEATTTDRLVPKKILSLNGYIYNNQLKTTNKLSPLYNSLFFKNTIKSSSSSSSSSSSTSSE